MIISFELTMPNVGSWDNKWTGESSKYYLHKKVLKSEVYRILEKKQWYYNFGDGWTAKINAEIVSSVEKINVKKFQKVFLDTIGW